MSLGYQMSILSMYFERKTALLTQLFKFVAF